MFIAPVIIRSLPVHGHKIIHGRILTPAKTSGDGQVR